MIDVSRKVKTLRTATARAVVRVHPTTLAAMRNQSLPKGDPLPVARVAAIHAAKNTSTLIPYCHPIPLDYIECAFETGTESITITTMVRAIARTGVEMEALTAASAAALTIYDMMKAVDETLEIAEVKLLRKTGGKADVRYEVNRTLRAAVLVSSDGVAAGRREDTSGKRIVTRLKEAGVDVTEYDVLPDEASLLEARLLHYAERAAIDLVLTTGGTGPGPRDVMPEVTRKVVERELPGVVEALRSYGQERTPFAMFSRGIAGIRNKTVIINLPGSSTAVQESLDALLPWVFHVFRMIEGESHDG